MKSEEILPKCLRMLGIGRSDVAAVLAKPPYHLSLSVSLGRDILPKCPHGIERNAPT